MFCRVSLIATLVWASGFSAHAAEAQSAVKWDQFLSRHDLVWDSPATNWESGAFIGNGLLGAMIYFVPAPGFLLCALVEFGLPSNLFAFALQLIGRLGTTAQRTRADRDATAGELFGVWNTQAADGVCVVEWADKVETTLPADHLRIDITVIDENRRHFDITAHGERYAALVAGLLPREPAT